MAIRFELLSAELTPRRRAELKRLADELRDKPTPAEDFIWPWLRRRSREGFRFRRQHVLGPYIADFYCREAALVIELDGSIHDAQRERDACRDELLRRGGLTVLRFPNDMVFNQLEHVLALIEQALQR